MDPADPSFSIRSRLNVDRGIPDGVVPPAVRVGPIGTGKGPISAPGGNSGNGESLVQRDGPTFDINGGFRRNQGPQDARLNKPRIRSYANATSAGPQYPRGPRARPMGLAPSSSITDEIPNPYLENMDLEACKEVSTEDLRKTFAGIPEPPMDLPEGLCVRTFKMNRDLVVGRVAHLQKRGLIVYLPEYNPSRDVLDNWVDSKLVRDLQVTIEQVKVISRLTYLVVLGSHEDQRKTLATTPFYINKRTAIVLPWTADLDLGAI